MVLLSSNADLDLELQILLTESSSIPVIHCNVNLTPVKQVIECKRILIQMPYNQAAV